MQKQHGAEPRWHAAIAVLVAIALYITLPPRIAVGPLWLLPVLLLVIMVPLNLIDPRRRFESRITQTASISIVAILNAFNIGTIVTLCVEIGSAHPHRAITGALLMPAAAQIWLTNVIVYALWFWQIDAGGPAARARCPVAEQPLRSAFLFPQMSMPLDLRNQIAWRPKFIDYVFLSFTNATAFSPTDTFPLTAAAKVFMMAEGLTSLVTIAIIAGRAVNILGS